MSWYILKVSLASIRPLVWRRLCVPSDLLLAELHDAIQFSFGWQDYHLHEFRANRRRYGVPDVEGPPRLIDECRCSLREVLPRKHTRMRYLYDFGDDWWHNIRVEEIRSKHPLLPTGGGRKPRVMCLGGRRAAPPEDCGGPHGYAELLEALANPGHARHEELLAWVGEEYDSGAFSLASINEELLAIRV